MAAQQKKPQMQPENRTELAVVQQYRPEPSPELLRTVASLPRRDLKAVTESIRSFIMASPHIARRCLYCKPVGKDKGGRQNFSVGPSVRFTELAMQQFGDMWLRSYLTDETSGKVTTETVLFDLQTRNIYTAQDTSPVWNDNQAETARDRSFAFSRRDAIMQAVRPQWELIERDVKRTVMLSFVADETPPKDDTPEKKDVRAAKAMWSYITNRFNAFGLPVDPKDENNVLMRITDDEHERIDRLYKLLGIINWLDDGNQGKVNDVIGYVPPGSKPPVTKTTVADQPPAAQAGTTPPPATAAFVTTQTASPAAAPAAAPAPGSSGMTRAEFEATVRQHALRSGNTTDKQLDDIVLAEFGAQTLAVVPEKDFSKIIDYFVSKGA